MRVELSFTPGVSYLQQGISHIPSLCSQETCQFPAFVQIRFDLYQVIAFNLAALFVVCLAKNSYVTANGGLRHCGAFCQVRLCNTVIDAYQKEQMQLG